MRIFNDGRFILIELDPAVILAGGGHLDPVEHTLFLGTGFYEDLMAEAKAIVGELASAPRNPTEGAALAAEEES